MDGSADRGRIWGCHDHEEWEAHHLAPYAQKSRDSAGRCHAEPAHPLRTCYQRDRARIVHSRAFRRLEYKTQVFLNGTGDHLRTRLTHTIEVASVSRAVARALGLNEDLAEAIALAHDLGHSPFGHAGEETLAELMAGVGGFEHNLQSLRVVERLECKYPWFAGLNLSREVLEGLDKHRAAAGPAGCLQPSLEAQAADLADEIAYYSHDLEDGLEHGLITLDQLEPLTAWGETADAIRAANPGIPGRDLTGYAIRCLIDRQVEDVVHSSAARIAAAGVADAGQVRRHPVPLIQYGPERGRSNRELREFLYANLYYHPAVADVNRRACRQMRALFEACLADPALLGEGAARRIADDGRERAVCDYISGMTDRFVIEECRRLNLAGPAAAGGCS